jgi:hypothetical protein
MIKKHKKENNEKHSKMLKWMKDLYTYHTKENMHVLNKHKSAQYHVIKKLEIKMAMKYYYTSIRIAKLLNSGTMKCWQGST